MKYRINTTNYQDFHTFEINKLPPRSYFIPYPDREQADRVSGAGKRYGSPKVVCLNGEWDFKFYPRPGELPEVIDTDDMQFDRLDVPSCWQFRGYAKPFYVNMRYQFPYQPPEIPTTEKVGKSFCWIGSDHGIGPRWQEPEEEYNYVGVYRRFFEVEDCTKNHVLSFLGVASCIDLYVNGSFAGYSEGSHNTAEFDITSYIHAGTNELVAVVRRWCNGTYLECQDMFRNNGIFRDVLLRISEKGDIWDIGFKTRKTARGYRAAASAKLYADGEVTFILEGNGISERRTVQSKNRVAKAVFEDLPVEEWNAESPVLYDLYYEVPGSCVKIRAGFKDVTIRGAVFYLNDRKVKLHGVNHHDTSCDNGYTLTPEEIERDMKLCKEYNIDTVRTSHYPPDPYLLELCDELGIYVVDEADLETHGTMSHRLPPDYNRISNDPAWARHYVDRARRLYQRDKTHVSVILWSLGNEAGGIYNTDRMYDYLKKHTNLPVHYESAVHTKKKAYDVGSEMYPPIKRVHAIGEKTYRVRELCDRPYFLCEYAHAMGVGPGNAEGYWKEIYAYDNLMGGCVWEMVDHAVRHADGTYTYGGDHGEWEHDGNFCVDGMFYPDRTPSTGARIMRFIYRPIRMRHLGGDRFEIFNTTAFSAGSRYRLVCRWSDGSEMTLVPEAGPLSREEIVLDTKVLDTKLHREAAGAAGKDLMLTIVTIDTKDGADREAAREQIVLEEQIAAVPEDAGCVEPASALATGGQTENGADMAADTALKTGGFAINGGRPVIQLAAGCLETADPYTILFRAPTDNDFNFSLHNCMEDFLEQQEDVLSVEREENRITVTTRILCKKQTFLCTDCYEGSAEGLVVTSRLHCEKGRGNLPRFGKAFRLDNSFGQVRYLGRNGESYADMKEQVQIEEAACRVSDMTEPNIRPQESGNRCDCRWAALSDGRQTVTFTALEQPFELGIKPYSDRELLKMRHREEETVTGTYVTISAFQMGIGTGICGPKTAKEYCYPMERDYVLKFLIRIEQEEPGQE